MLLTTLLSLVFPLLITAAFLLQRERRRRLRRPPERLTDQMIRTIEERGQLAWDEDEPLDPDRIRSEEERFWKEAAWDEPEQI